jgi:MarR family 2-MHQ and catechol resistance regulon transcriptional repressor
VVEDKREAYIQDRVRDSGCLEQGSDASSVEILLSFVYTYDLLHQVIARYMADYGLSKSSVHILTLLRDGPVEGMQLHDLGRLLFVSRANITGLIDHLEHKGYVKRVVNTHDRRARFARVTKKAETLLDEFLPMHYNNVRIMLQDLSSAEKQTLLCLFKKVRRSVAAHCKGCARQEPATFEATE